VHLLLVEDDDAIAQPLVRGLERQGFDVHHEITGRGALDRLAGDDPVDTVLLDLGLPDLDGYEVCRQIRAISSVPVIVITARGDELDRVLGLELGADDYIVKPFGFRELVARIRAVARRSGERPDTADLRTDLGAGVVIDARARRVTVDGTEVNLTRKEFDLLAVLAEDPGATRTRDDILGRVWDTNWYGPTKTLDVHIAALRRKLGTPTLIETVRGVGFRLREPDREVAPPDPAR
jgi:two-component system response regulator RegX3